MRQRKLIAQVIAGHPDRLVTLTSRRAKGKTAYAEAQKLVHAWRLNFRILVREYSPQPQNFFAIFEGTKQHWPHIHIPYRGDWIDQDWLSKRMAKLTDSPVVDVRKVKGNRETARYVAKYTAKAPDKFGTLKRYWHSKAWELDSTYQQKPKRLWDRQDMSLRKWCDAWSEFGWTVQLDGDRRATASPPGIEGEAAL